MESSVNCFTFFYRSHNDELQNVEHEVENQIYGIEDEGEGEDLDSNSMQSNLAYMPQDVKPIENHYEHL